MRLNQALIFILSIPLLAISLAAQETKPRIPTKEFKTPLELALHLAADPDNDRFAEDLVPVLAKAGRTKEAKEILLRLETDSGFQLLSRYLRYFYKESQSEEFRLLFKYAIDWLKNPKNDWNEEGADRFTDRHDVYRFAFFLGSKDASHLYRGLWQTAKNPRERLTIAIALLEGSKEIHDSKDFPFDFSKVEKTAMELGDLLARSQLLRIRARHFPLTSEDFAPFRDLRSEVDDLDEIVRVIAETHLIRGKTANAEAVLARYGLKESYWFTGKLKEYGKLDTLNRLLDEKRDSPDFGRHDYSHWGEMMIKVGRNTEVLAWLKEDERNDEYWLNILRTRLASSYFEKGRTALAYSILKDLEKRALSIDFVHLTEHSVGASSGSRKMIYLKKVIEIYLRQNRTDLALDLISRFKDKEEYAREGKAEMLSLVAIHLDKSDVDAARELFVRAEELVSDGYELEELLLNRASSALKNGRSAEASDLIARFLNEKDSEDDLLRVLKISLHPNFVQTREFESKFKEFVQALL